MTASRSTALIVAAVVLVAGITVAQADPVVQLVGLPSFDGTLYTYQYLINYETPGSWSDPIWELLIGNVDDADLTPPIPPHWAAATDQVKQLGGYVQWSADAFDEAQTGWIQPGEDSSKTLSSCFTLTSPWAPGHNTAQFAFNGDLAPSGNVDGPQAPSSGGTPEPVTLVLLMASGVGALTMRRRR